VTGFGRDGRWVIAETLIVGGRRPDADDVL